MQIWPALLAQQQGSQDLLPPSLQRILEFAGVDENGQVWIEGETLRYMFASFLETGNPMLAPLLRELKGVRLSRDAGFLYFEPEYRQDFRINVNELRNTPAWQLYAIDVPADSKFAVRMDDGVLRVSQVDRSTPATWSLLVNLPFLPDHIYMHSLELDLVSGAGKVVAGVFGDWISVVANTQLRETKASFEGVSFWESLLQTMHFDHRDSGPRPDPNALSSPTASPLPEVSPVPRASPIPRLP